MTTLIVILIIVLLGETGLLVTLLAVVEKQGEYAAELENELEVLTKELADLHKQLEGGGGSKS